MSHKLNEEARMTLKELFRRGWTRCRIAKVLGVSEGAVRYHLKRQAEEAEDGRSRQRQLAEGWSVAIEAWMEGLGESPLNLARLHEWLVEEHEYPGSLRSVQRYVGRHFPPPRKRARRRVETPAGAQAQADWATFTGVPVGGRQRDLYAFHLQLSHSRHDAVVWSERKDQLSWLAAHNGSLRRLEGVPATIRVDNEKTAVSEGAGAWGRINPAYRRYALAARFHVDACPPRSPGHKGKVERRIRDQRLGADPRGRRWESLEELQEWTDDRMRRSALRRICPATGTSVHEAWLAEKPMLGPLPVLPEPFDLVGARKVAVDCTIRFEGRTYSVPFALVGRTVEARGCARAVQVLWEGRVVASHPRRTASRVVIDPRHYEGEAEAEILPPLPLGRMGRRLEEIAAMEPQRRPLDLYAALAEVAR